MRWKWNSFSYVYSLLSVFMVPRQPSLSANVFWLSSCLQTSWFASVPWCPNLLTLGPFKILQFASQTRRPTKPVNKYIEKVQLFRRRRITPLRSLPFLIRSWGHRPPNVILCFSKEKKALQLLHSYRVHQRGSWLCGSATSQSLGFGARNHTLRNLGCKNQVLHWWRFVS